MIKKVIDLVIISLTLASLLSGCFLYDNAVGNNIGPFIDPMKGAGEDFIPDSNAVKVISLDVPIVEETIEEIPEEDDGIIIIDENHIYLKKPPIVEVNEDNQINYYYEGDSFRFQVSFVWRNTMEVDIITEIEDNYEIQYYTFYFVPEGQPLSIPQKAQVIALRIAPYKYFQRKGHGANGVAATETVNSSDEYVYTRIIPTEDPQLGADFPDIEGFTSIMKFQINNWNFTHVERD